MGSAFSSMSADPRAPTDVQTTEPGVTGGTHAAVEIEPSPTNVAALRAAALKSALQKRRNGNSSAAEKEDGEVSEGDDGHGHSYPETQATLPMSKTSPPDLSESERPPSGSAPAPPSPRDEIKRSTVVTISNDTGQVKRQTLSVSGGNTMLDEDETQYLEIIRKLLHDGVPPDTLIDNGAPSRFVTRVCEEIVAGSKSPKPFWNQARSPVREGSGAGSSNTGFNVESSSRDSESSSSSSSIEVAVHSVRRGSGSESDNEAAVERMTVPAASLPRPSLPLIIPTSSWAPSSSQTPSHSGAVRIESYRPPSRPASALATPMSSSPFTPNRPAIGPYPTLPSFPPPPIPPQPHKRQKRHRDYDSVNDNSMVLNYGDEDPPTPSTAPPAVPVAKSAPASANSAVPSSTVEEHREEVSGKKPAVALAIPPTADSRGRAADAPPSSVSSLSSNVTPTADLAEVRRKALESMRQSMRKRKTPTAPATPVETATAGSAQLDRTVKGSSVEVPMDIDEEEPEEGEIEETPGPASSASTPTTSAAATPPVFVTSTSLRRVGSTRGVKRPLAEDLNESSDRPKTVARVAFNRRAFGAPQRSSRLVLCLDESSDDDCSSDEESCLPYINVPNIVIPSPFPEPDTAALLAEKAESIRKLKEQIAARLLAKKNSLSAPASPATGSPAPADDVRRVEEAEAAAENVGVEGLASDVVRAAVLAAAEEQKQSDIAASPPRGKGSAKGKGKTKGKGKAKAKGIRKASAEPSTAEQPSTSVKPGSEDTPGADAPPSVDLNALQAIEPQPDTLKHGNFHAYRPLLPSYPQLAASSLELLPPREEHQKDFDVDWALVSSIILTSRLQKDPSASICRSEAAGGSCADSACEDVHILRSEPTDDDIIMYATRLISLQGSSSAKLNDASEALRQAKAEVVAQAAEEDMDLDSRQWGNPRTLTALVDITAQRLRAR